MDQSKYKCYIPIPPPRVDSRKGPPRENMHFVYMFVVGPWKKWPQMAPRARRTFVPTNPDLADILGDTDFDFESVHFFDVLNPKFPGSRFPNFQISRRRRRRRTNSQIPTRPLFQRTQGSNTSQGALAATVLQDFALKSGAEFLTKHSLSTYLLVDDMSNIYEWFFGGILHRGAACC